MFALTLALLLVIGLLRNFCKRAFLLSFLKIAYRLLARHHQHVDLRVEKDAQHASFKRQSVALFMSRPSPVSSANFVNTS